MSEQMRELRDLQGGVAVGGARAFRWGELADVIEIFTPGIEAALAQVGDVFEWMVASKIVQPGQTVRLDSRAAMAVASSVAPLLGKVPGLLRAVQKASAIATGLPLDVVQKLDMQAGLELAFATYEANRDFFLQRLAPLLREKFDQASGKWTRPPQADANAGPSSSSN